MKKITYILFLTFFISANAQDWRGSYTEALEMAKMENKPFVLVFSGSDWCAPCIKLERNIWQSQMFKEYSQKHYVLYKADFPKKKANKLPEPRASENRSLAERFNPKGHFPLILVLDKDAKVLGSTGYQKWSPEQYISYFNSFL